MGVRYSYTYILTNESNAVMYIGVTGDLLRRIQEHIEKKCPGFTAKYNVHKLVYYEVYTDVVDAILREKQLKSWKREWKNNLVNKRNPTWADLFPSLNYLNPSENIPELQ